MFYEARLLDEWRWREWYELLSEDIRYWSPTRTNRLRVRSFTEEVTDGIQVAFFDENKKSLDGRVRQMETGSHWAEDPPSRTRRLITNVWISDVREENGLDEYSVRSYFLCYRNRLESETNIWAGMRDDVLRKTAIGYEIARRTILLDQNVVLAKHLSVFF
ncbi:MAG: 3-phenylpropionate/cinnamic acid dioxygenase subunit beta [Actinomycetota bacterium]|nr:3-phenylpropionate/cinnamic acid dioxygenase subunit beta [Actinomycetota bacterium]